MKIIGCQKQWQFLKQSAESGKLSHSYLFMGPDKIGKRTLAKSWASFLLGQDVEKEVHPDLILVGPEDGEIKIDQIRDLMWKLSLKPYSAPLKVAIIDKAHLMNENAQNCFLKTLEEPKDKTILILISEQQDSLLPTILSRCQIVKFHPVSQKEIESNFSKEIAEVSMGRPGLAVEFSLDSKKLESMRESFKEIAEVSKADLSFRFQYAKKISEEDNLKEILETWLFYFRNLLLESGGEHYAKILKKIQEVNFLIFSTNVNKRLALDTLMLEL